jgi:antitoxin Phd
MAKWQLQDAKARFSQLVDDAVAKGPQIVTRRGIATAVLVAIDEWSRAQQSARPSVKDVLLGDGPRFRIPLPKRSVGKARKPPVLD